MSQNKKVKMSTYDNATKDGVLSMAIFSQYEKTMKFVERVSFCERLFKSLMFLTNLVQVFGEHQYRTHD